jgi:hypothetical protein
LTYTGTKVPAYRPNEFFRSPFKMSTSGDFEGGQDLGGKLADAAGAKGEDQVAFVGLCGSRSDG